MRHYDEIYLLLAGGQVRRWHTMPHSNPQSVAEHSANCLDLLFMLHPSPSMNLVKGLLWHDRAERYVGDIPSPVRREDDALSMAYNQAELSYFQTQIPSAYEAISSLTDEERRWLRAIDTLELLLWAENQKLLGNQHCAIVAGRARRYLSLDKETPKEVTEFLNECQVRSLA